MKRLRLFASALFAAVMTVGCATHDNFVKTYDSWVGQDIRTYIAQAGYPDRTYTLPDGHVVYVYEKRDIVSDPVITPAFGFGHYGAYGGFGMTYYDNVDLQTCKLFLETNEKHIIVRWGYRGNDCRL
jgi:hypothetical protein